LGVLWTVPAPLPAQEESVRPGINESYKKDPNLPGRIKQFEGESREIFQKREEIVAACGLKPGMEVADVGAGTGLFTRLFAPKVVPEGKVYAVDITPAFIEHIEKTCKEEKIENVKCVLCTDTSVELPPNSVDLVFICDVYHHFEYPFKTLASIHKALRADGRMIVIDFKKVEGVTPKKMMEHVRGDQALTTKEITDSGFKLIDVPDLMTGQYVLRFEKAK
jgi:predicted methyltransferase